MIEFRLKTIIESKMLLNQTQLAIEMQMHRTSLNRIINNRKPVQVNVIALEKICRTLNVLPNDLLKIINDDGSVWAPYPTSPLPEDKVYFTLRGKKNSKENPENGPLCKI